MKNSLSLVLAKKLADLLDNRFEIWGIRFGLDPILDLLPGIGDVLGVGLGLYIVYVAKNLKMSPRIVKTMIMNILKDFLIGLLPILGPIVTIFYRSNQMNIKLIEEYLSGSQIEEGEIIG